MLFFAGPALIGIQGHAGFGYVLITVLAGVLILLAVALFTNNVVHHRQPQTRQERMRDENSPIISGSRDDCFGKQHGDRMQMVAATGAANASRFTATAAATVDPDSGEIVDNRTNCSSFPIG